MNRGGFGGPPIPARRGRGGGPGRRGPGRPMPTPPGAGGGFNRGPPMPARRGGGGFPPQGGFRGAPPPAARGGAGGPPPGRFGGGAPPPASRFGGRQPQQQQQQPPFGGGFNQPPPQNNFNNAPPPQNNFGGPPVGGGFGGGGNPGVDNWLHNNVTGDRAMEILEHKPVGTYLFRPSATPGFLTLSFKKEGGEVFHVRITKTHDGYLNDGDARVFPTLEALAKSKPRTLKQPILVGQL